MVNDKNQPIRFIEHHPADGTTPCYGPSLEALQIEMPCTKSRNHSGQTTSPTMNSRLLGEKANLQEKNESTTNKSCSNRICKSLLPECKCQFHSAFSRDILSASTRRAKGFSFAPTFEQIRCNDGHIDTQLWPHQTSWIFLWRALSASSGWGPVEYQPRKNHLLYGYVFGLVGSWSKVINRTQRVLPMPSTEEPSKKFISWKNLQGRLVIFRYSISHFSSWQPSLNHFKTCLQILGKPLLEEFQIQWPLDGAILKENAGKGCFWGSVLWPPDSTQTSSKELCTSTRLNPGTSHLFGSLQNQDPEVYINSCCQKTSDTPNIQGHDLPSCAPSKAPSTCSDLR